VKKKEEKKSEIEEMEGDIVIEEVVEADPEKSGGDGVADQIFIEDEDGKLVDISDSDGGSKRKKDKETVDEGSDQRRRHPDTSHRSR